MAQLLKGDPDTADSLLDFLFDGYLLGQVTPEARSYPSTVMLGDPVSLGLLGDNGKKQASVGTTGVFHPVEYVGTCTIDRIAGIPILITVAVHSTKLTISRQRFR